MNPDIWTLDAVIDFPGYWWVASAYVLLSFFEPAIWKKLSRWFPHPKGRKLVGRVALRLIIAITPAVNLMGLAWLLWEFYVGWKEGIRQNELVGIKPVKPKV